MIPPNKHSTLLALDTSGPACSVALLASGNTLQAYELEAQKHTREILPLVDKLLQKGGIEKSAIQGIIISAGPGAFTGLRVGAAVAMGLAAAWNVPLLPVSSLALLAATVQRHSGATKILAVMDARMGEVYAGLYDNGVCTVYADRFPAGATLAEDHYMPEAIDAFSLLDSAAWQPPLQGIELHYLRNDVVQR